MTTGFDKILYFDLSKSAMVCHFVVDVLKLLQGQDHFCILSMP